MIEQLLYKRYRIEKLLSDEGGFGRTFLALDTAMPENTFCVVKQLFPKNSNQDAMEKIRELFYREAKILQQLGEHPQIPRLLAYFEEDNEFYLVQEYIDGHTLAEELTHPLPEKDVINILLDLLSILYFIHKNNVIHRDIKPSNIMRRDADKKLFLIDFGSVKIVDNNPENSGQNNPNIPLNNINKPETIIGTPGYMPLEQSIGKTEFNSDLYSLGIVGLQCLTGKPATEIEKQLQQSNSISNLVNINDKFADFLSKMIERHPHYRYVSASEALEQLKRLEEDKTATTILENKPETSVINTEVKTSNKFLVLASLFILGIGASIFGIIAYYQTSIPNPKLPLNKTAIEGVLDKTDPIISNSNLNLFNKMVQSYYYEVYYFRGKQNQQITIEMNSQTFDPSLKLNSPDGIELGSNDDIDPNNINSKLIATLPKNGIYKVIVTSSEPEQTGTYQLSAFVEK